MSKTKKKATKVKAQKVTKTTTGEKEKVMGFRAGTQAARMYELLSDGKPRTIAQVHKVISDTTESNVANGLLYVLRKRAAETGEFHILQSKGTLTLVNGPRPAKTPKAKAAPKVKAKAKTNGGVKAKARKERAPKVSPPPVDSEESGIEISD